MELPTFKRGVTLGWFLVVSHLTILFDVPLRHHPPCVFFPLLLIEFSCVTSLR
jgi:hypothetical protein